MASKRPKKAEIQKELEEAAERLDKDAYGGYSDSDEHFDEYFMPDRQFNDMEILAKAHIEYLKRTAKRREKKARKEAAGGTTNHQTT